MKVAFSNPPWWERREHVGRLRWRWRSGVRAGSRWPFTRVWKASPDRPIANEYMPYPFFMGYAATWVARHLAQGGSSDDRVVFRDSIALRESYKRYFEWLESERPDWIFIESATPSWDHDVEILRQIHQRLPQARIVLTGPITSKGESLLDELPVHACIRGEYEKGAVRVLEGESSLIDHDLLSLQEMNSAPYPWYDESMATRYYDGNPKGQSLPHAQVWSSRGCPFKCIFCVWPATMTGNDPDGSGRRTVRHYSADYMEGFLSEIVAKHGFKTIYFDDDTFNLGNAHVERMCAVMERIGLPWTAMCRADTSRIDTWQKMKDSGCIGVKLGFESGNQYVVDQIVNKHLDLEFAREVVHEIKRVGMTVHGTFTYGLPGETREQMQDTKAFISSLPFDSVQESGTAEIEGTPLHTLRERGGLEAYAGAHVDGGYRREVDGSKKYRGLVDELRDG